MPSSHNVNTFLIISCILSKKKHIQRSNCVYKSEAELPTLRFKKVRELCEMLGARVTAGHRSAQAQEEQAGREALFTFSSGITEFLKSRVLAGSLVIGCA